MKTQELRISEEDFASITTAEAVVIGEWKREDDGREWGEFLMCGTREECEAYAGEPETLIIPNGFECLGKTVVNVKDLLEPKTTWNEANHE